MHRRPAGNTPLTSEQIVWKSEETGSGDRGAEGCITHVGAQETWLVASRLYLSVSEFRFWGLQTVLMSLVKFPFTVWRVKTVQIQEARKMTMSSWMKQEAPLHSHMLFLWTEWISSEGTCSARLLLTLKERLPPPFGSTILEGARAVSNFKEATCVNTDLSWCSLRLDKASIPWR